MSSCSRSSARELVAGGAGAAHVDREPQRVVAVARPGAPARRSSSTSRPGDLADRRARRAQRRDRLARAARCPSRGGVPAGGVERAAEQRARAGGLDAASRSGRPRARRAGSPSPRCSIADCVRLPTILCVLETTRSAPSESACSGSSSWKARCAPQASSTTSGTPCAWATSASAGDVGDRAEVGRRDDRRAPTAPGVSRERAVERLGRQAVRDAQLGVELGRHEGRPQAGQDQPVDRARVGVALDHDLVARCAASASRRRGCPATRR